jgi:hypothetical protein
MHVHDANDSRQLVGTSAVSIQGRSVFIVEQANLDLTAVFDASAVGDLIESFSLRSLDVRHPPLHLQLSQLKLIHAVRTAPGVYVSTTITLEDAYTNANLFKEKNWMMLSLKN